MAIIRLKSIDLGGLATPENPLKKVYIGKMDDTIDPETGVITYGTTGHTAMVYVYYIDKKYSLTKLDVEDILQEEEFKDGLRVDDHKVYVKIDDNSEPYLTVSPSGVSLNGIDSAITSAYTINKEKIEELSGVTAEMDEVIAKSLCDLDSRIIEIGSGITTEAERAISAETAISSAVSVVQSAVTAEVERATSAETLISSAVTVEKERAVSGETYLNTIKENKLVPSSGIAINRLEETTEISILLDNKTLKVDSAVGLKSSIKIASVSASSENVKEEYALVDADGGEITGAHIKIYKDSSLISTYIGKMDDTINPETGEITSGTTGHTAMCWVYQLADGKYSLTKVDIEEMILEDEFKDGLVVNDHKVYVKVDNNSEDFLSVSPSGVSINGIQSAITSAVTIEKDRAMSAETEIMSAVTVETERAISAETIISSAVSAVESAVTVEQERAVSAETTIQSAITKEIEDREAAIGAESARTDAAIEAAVGAESARTDTAIETAIGAESARTDAAIEAAIGAESARSESVYVKISNIEQKISAGTEIAKFEVSGNSISIYAPSGKSYEFKDGLEVNGDNVKVLIDPASDPYLKVSSSGVCLSGVTELERVMSASLNDFNSRLTSASTVISSAVTVEAERAVSAETILQSAITKEIEDRKAAIGAESIRTDAAIETAIGAESARCETTYLKEHQSLAGYATEQWVENKGYLTQHQDISGKADKSYVDNAIASESARCETTYLKEHQSLANYYTSAQTDSAIETAMAAETARTETTYAKPYTAGTNISIENNVISTSFDINFVKLTQAEYDALETKDENTMYVIIG